MRHGRAYLLRCWSEGRDGRGEASAWRFSVEDIGPESRRRGFGSFRALVAYLEQALVEEVRRPAVGEQVEDTP